MSSIMARSRIWVALLGLHLIRSKEHRRKRKATIVEMALLDCDCEVVSDMILGSCDECGFVMFEISIIG